MIWIIPGPHANVAANDTLPLSYDALCDWYLHLPSEQNKDCFLSLQLPNGPLTDFTNIETDIQQWNVKCGEKCKNCSSCHVYRPVVVDWVGRTLKQVYNWKVKQVKTSFHSTERLKINVTFHFSSHVLCDITGNLDRNVRKYVLSSNMDNDY